MTNYPTIGGMLGAGQLARLNNSAALDVGLDIKVLGGNPAESIFRILDPKQCGIIVPKGSDKKPDYTNEESLLRFAELVGDGNPVTTEWENIPAQTMIRLRELGLRVFPDPYFLEQIQDRILEKRLATSLGGTTVRYREVNTYQGLAQGVMALNRKCILKSRKGGYDGKLQWKITEQTDLKLLWSQIQKEAPGMPLILEEMIDIDFEVSTILGIDQFGQVKVIGPVYNIHENGILRYSIDPAPIHSSIEQNIIVEARKVGEKAKQSGYVGLLTIEWFVDTKGMLYVNEFAPRPHNSAHASLDSRDNSQNDLWMQAITGRTMRDPGIQGVVMMENILSQREFAGVISEATIDPSRIGFGRESRLYNYQKIPGLPDKDNTTERKLGHINHSGHRVDTLWQKVKDSKLSMTEFVNLIRAIP